VNAAVLDASVVLKAYRVVCNHVGSAMIKGTNLESGMHYILFYEFVDDYLTRRTRFRDEHLAKAWAASDRGELVLAGALTHPADGAVVIFKGDSPAVAETFANTDPYVLNGLVKRWWVREWTTVAGKDAATPVKPNSVS